MQYDVHDILADLQLHVSIDLQPHATCCKGTFGEMYTLPCIGTMISSFFIHPNVESSSLEMLYSSAALKNEHLEMIYVSQPNIHPSLR